MSQRRSSSGRPTGTDGFDFSYRMTVDSRYTKVPKLKSKLFTLFSIQGLLILVGLVPALLQVAKAEDPDVLILLTSMTSFLSLIFGELGRTLSRSAILKMYLVVSFVTMFLSVVYATKTKILSEAIQSGVANYWENKPLQLIKLLNIFIELLVKTYSAITTLSLIKNMSPPKS